jgi:hypothetical protein
VSKLRNSALFLVGAASLAVGISVVSCTSSDDVDTKTPDGSIGSGGSGTGGTGATPATGGAGGGTGGAATGGAGGGGTGESCNTKVAVPDGAPLITDFETLTIEGDGGTNTTTYRFAGTANVLGGAYAYADELSTKDVSLPAGHDTSSTRAFSNAIHARSLFPDDASAPDGGSSWGGGLGLWLNCVDARGYGGIHFWARGSVPSPDALPVNNATVLLTIAETLETPDGTCAGPCTRPKKVIELSDTWTEYTILWGDFTAGDAAGTSVPATGDNLTGIEIAVSNTDVVSEILVEIDDVSFVSP